MGWSYVDSTLLDNLEAWMDTCWDLLLPLFSLLLHQTTLCETLHAESVGSTIPFLVLFVCRFHSRTILPKYCDPPSGPPTVGLSVFVSGASVSWSIQSVPLCSWSFWREQLFSEANSSWSAKQTRVQFRVCAMVRNSVDNTVRQPRKLQAEALRSY